MDTNLVLGIVTALGAGLSGAVAKLWLWMTAELKECKDDRKELHGRIEAMHGKISDISITVAKMQFSRQDEHE